MNDASPDLFVLLAALFATLLVGVAVGRAARRSIAQRSATPPDRPEHRVTALCARLTGDPERDRPLCNRVLSLGPDVVPLLVDEIARALRDPDGAHPARLARLEELVADFGLAAVGPVTARLARIQPTTPLGPSLVRVLRRLGAPGAVAFLRAGLEQPDLAPFLPRWRLPDGRVSDPGAALLAALADRPAERRRGDLDAMAGLLADHPRVIDALWERWDDAGRVALLDWLAAWLPLAEARFVRAGLEDAAPAVRQAAARLAGLLATPGLLDPVRALARDPDPACRTAAVHALAAFPTARDALRAAAADEHPDVAVAAVLGLLRRSEDEAAAALSDVRVAADEPRLGLLREALAARPVPADTGAAPEPDTPDLLAGLESPDPAVREVAMRVLALRAEADPRARERLILIADGRDPRDRVAAVAALSFVRDSTAPDLLARALREPAEPPDPEGRARLQEAVRHLGVAALAPLARRVRSEAPERIEALLAILRVQPYADAVAPLLRALENVRLGSLEGTLAATLYVGGPEVRAALDDGLRQPGRGLLTPALRYLAAYGTPADLPLLVDLFDRHPPLRTILLTLIEAQGAAAVRALEGRIRRGGEDAVLLSLEQRLDIVRTCTAHER